MKKLTTTVICFLLIFGSLSAQNSAPKGTPQYDNPMDAMQQMMQQLQKMFGGNGNSEQGDSTQNFGFQQFKMPFGGIDSTMSKAFGFSFDGNGFKSLTPENGDSTQTNGMMQMQDQFKKMMPNMDFDKLFQGQMPFGGSDPSIVPPMDRMRQGEAPKTKKKYQTERL
jgi:hypothetical protein